jgi:hypothetical protein
MQCMSFPGRAHKGAILFVPFRFVRVRMRARNQMHPDLSGCGNDRLILLLKGLFFPFDISTGYLPLFANLNIFSLWSKASFLFLLWIIYFWKKPLAA